MLTCPASAFPERETEWWAQADHSLDGVAPTLAADFSRERYALNGAHSSSPQVVARGGGAKAVVSAAGAVVMAPANVLAFDYASGRRRLVVEGAATNLFIGSAAPTAAQGITVTAQTYTVSFWGTGTLTLSGAATGAATGGGAAVRTAYTVTATAGTLTVTPSGSVAKVQVEAGGFASSYIETTTGAVTRVTDVVTWSAGAAALLTMAGPVTLCLRGSISHASASSQTLVLTSSASSYIIRIEASGAIRLDLDATNRKPGFSIVAEAATNVGLCASWAASGRSISVNGSATATDATAPTYVLGAIYIGNASGMTARERFELDEILVWPAKGSASAVQAQARVWA
jgi:hypothetical protein